MTETHLVSTYLALSTWDPSLLPTGWRPVQGFPTPGRTEPGCTVCDRATPVTDSLKHDSNRDQGVHYVTEPGH